MGNLERGFEVEEQGPEQDSRKTVRIGYASVHCPKMQCGAGCGECAVKVLPKPSGKHYLKAVRRDAVR